MLKKSLNQIGLIIFIGLIISNLVMYKSCTNSKEKYKLEHDRVVSLYEQVDSILSLPPDTVLSDPIIIKNDSIITVTKYFANPNKPILEAKIYMDSIINDSIDLRVEISAKELYSITYDYKQIYKYQEKIIKQYVSKPFEVIREVHVNTHGLFINAGLGYSDKFSAKVGLMYLNKNETTFNYDFVRYGNKNIHIVSYGIKL